jgi:predicted nucleotidyltransferase
MGQFREWTDSFHHPAQRSAYIQQVCGRIVERYHPEKIILFGSHAWGQPAPESDLDLLVVMNFAGSPVRQAITISRELGLVTPMDLLIRTPEQFRHRLEIGDSFMREIVTRGKVMYEARHG